MYVSAEINLVVTRNRITNMPTGGIGAYNLFLRCDLIDNNIAYRAYGNQRRASIGVTQLFGHLRIAGNVIIDTGLSQGGDRASANVYGIGLSISARGHG